MKSLPVRIDELIPDEVESDFDPLEYWFGYFSLGAWPLFGQIPELLGTPEFIEGNTP